MSDFLTNTGTPIFYQGENNPTPNENINPDYIKAFKENGSLIFYYARIEKIIYWLKSVDNDNNQDWGIYPADTDNLAYISVLPILGNMLYWFVSTDAEPTENEPITVSLLEDPNRGLLWWKRDTSNIFKLTAYNAETAQQTWTQIL